MINRIAFSSKVFLKDLLTLFSILLISYTSYAQIAEGTYKNQNEYLLFEKDSIYFKIYSGGGIYNIYEASGKYKIKKGKIIIEPNITNPPITFSKTKKQHQDSLYFLITTSDSVSNYGGIAFYDKNKKIIFGQSFKAYEKIFVNKKFANNIDLICIGIIGHIPVALKIDTNFFWLTLILWGLSKKFM